MARFRGQKTSSTASDKPVVIRKLGHLEKLQSSQHLLEVYIGCAISCRYVIPDALLASDQSVESTVERAFARAMLQHPLLTVGRIKDDSKQPSWVRLSRIDLSNHIEWRTVKESEDCDNLVQEVLESLVNQTFSHLETRPPWRSVILRPANSNFVDVIFGWDHTTGDGKSGKIFQESLLASFNALADDKEAGPVLKDRTFDVPETALTPHLHNMLKFPISWGFLLAEVRDTIKGSPEPKDSPYIASWAPIQMTPFTTRQSTITVGEDALPKVLEACRQNKTTLTGLVHALALVSLSTRLPKEAARAFQSGTPICLRRFDKYRTSKHSDLDVDHTVTNFVTYWNKKYDEDTVAMIRKQVGGVKADSEKNADLEALVWYVAAEVREELSKKLASGTKDDVIGLVKFVNDWRSFTKDRVKDPKRTLAWEVSNLGVIDGKGEKWAIEHSSFTQSSAVAGPALCLSLVAVKGKALAISNCWQVEVIDDGLARGLLSDLETWLNGLGRNGHVSFGEE